MLGTAGIGNAADMPPLYQAPQRNRTGSCEAYARFGGLDIHRLRAIDDNRSPVSGQGRGVQFETVVWYDNIAPAFSLGVDGRYWAIWTDASAYTNMFGSPCPCQTLPSKTGRAGVFFQGAYRFGAL